MLLNEIAALTDGVVAVDCPGASAGRAYASDLLSDIMGHCGDDAVLVTIQNHLNPIAVCTLVGIGIIVLCHDRPVPDDMAEAAKREGVAIITTALSQFEVSVRLAALPVAAK